MVLAPGGAGGLSGQYGWRQREERKCTIFNMVEIHVLDCFIIICLTKTYNAEQQVSHRYNWTSTDFFHGQAVQGFRLLPEILQNEHSDEEVEDINLGLHNGPPVAALPGGVIDIEGGIHKEHHNAEHAHLVSGHGGPRLFYAHLLLRKKGNSRVIGHVKRSL